MPPPSCPSKRRSVTYRNRMLKGAILNNMDVGSKLFFEEKFSNLEVITAKLDEQLSSLIRLQATDDTLIVEVSFQIALGEISQHVHVTLRLLGCWPSLF